MAKRYTSFSTFYPYYLSEHRNGVCRLLHFLGTTGVLAMCVISATMGPWWLFLLSGLAGYGPAWVGHFFFEKNRPATFQYPLYSLAADFVMYGDILRGRVPLVVEMPPGLMSSPSPAD